MLLSKYKNLFPFHFLLIPVLFIWHVCNEYFGLIPVSYWSRYLLYYTALSLIFFLWGKIFFKKTDKAGVWASVLLIIFFFWGSTHDFLNAHVPTFFSSYRFLLCLLLILLVLLGARLRKKNSTVQNANSFLNLLFIVLLLLEGINSLYKTINKEGKKNNQTYYNTPLHPPLLSEPDSLKPDIFYIIFDEYASSTSLKQYLDYDNSKLDSVLVKNGFYIAAGSKSNYNSTPFSLASTFSLDYFNAPLEEKKIFPKELLQAQSTIRQTIFPGLLKKQGYVIKNYGLCDINGKASPEEPFFNPEIRDVLYKETFWGRTKYDILWHIQTRVPSLFPPHEEIKKAEKVLRRNRNNYKNLLTELSIQTGQPRFVFGHIMMPHGRYHLNKNGEKRHLSTSDDHPGTRDSLYLDQLIYTNTWLDSLAAATNKKNSRPRVVVIQGDHGRRDIGLYDALNREKQFMNLNAFYFSDKNYELLYDSISSVNTFRVVLNKYFRAGLPLLKDSTILMQ
ncbi:MAG: hypothetical protein ACXWV8_09880 [Chitinophagaceae bacterium]